MTTSSIKPFVAGAITALSAVAIIQRLMKKKKKQSPPSRRRTPQPFEKLFDSIGLQERMIRKAEAAIQGRTSRLIVVVERCTNDHNYSAILRTVEALGIQHVYIIAPSPSKKNNNVNNNTITSSTGKVVKNTTTQEVEARAMHHLFAQRATEWLTVREFATTRECLATLHENGYVVWATDLSQQAVCLTKEDLAQVSCNDNDDIIPPKLAIVFGTEAVGCTNEMLEESDLRVYLPLRGFADSLNLSVATALVIQQLLVLDPSIIGDMSEQERRGLRQAWFSKLAQQRLLTASQKKRKTRLQNKVLKCQELQATQRGGTKLTREQVTKLEELPSIQQELHEMEQDLQKRATAAVADLVENPPLPITDMRRADEHRVCYVGKNTKKRNQEAWSSMPATTTYQLEKESSASYFRTRAANAVNGSNEE